MTYINIPGAGSPSWKPPVDTFSDLPTTGNIDGDARVTKDTSDIYVWNGTVWVLSNASVGLHSLNGQTGSTQTFANGTDGTSPNWVSASDVHTLNIPFASVSGVTEGAISNTDFNTFNNKQTAGNYITALTGDVSATGPGSSAATVNSIGGSSAANVHSAELAANGATSSNTSNSIVRRDSSGNFSASTITASLTGHASADLPLTGGTITGSLVVTSTISASNFTGSSSGTNTGDVTLAAVGSSPNANAASLSGQVLTLQPADGTHPGVLTSSSQTIGGIKTFSSLINTDGGIDRSSSGTLTIGATNSAIINIGNSGATVNIQGTTIYENTPQLLSADPLITVNHGGGAGSGQNSGIEIEENAIITGYAETSSDRNSWIFKAPNTAGVATITPGVSGITLNQSSHDPVTIGTANGLSLSTQVLSLQAADSTHTGALTSTDWNTFNNKQTSGNYITALTGDVTASGPGSAAATISNGAITNAKVSATAAIDFSKLAALPSADILVGNVSNVATAVAMSGDVTITNAGVTTVANGAITNAKVSATAAIDFSKLAALPSTDILVGNGSNVATAVPMSGDISITNAGVTAYTGIVPYAKGGTNVSTNFTQGSVIFAGASGFAEDNANFFWDATNHRHGIGTTTPSTTLSLGGEIGRTIASERRTTSNSAGSNTTLRSGGATTGATDKSAGTLNLSTGTATGTGTGSINFNLPIQGTTGTTDSAAVNRGSFTSFEFRVEDSMGFITKRDPVNSTSGQIDNLDVTARKFINFTAATALSGFNSTSIMEGNHLWVYNGTGATITIINDASSTAANRIYTGTAGNVGLPNQAGMHFLYNSNVSRWIIVGIDTPNTTVQTFTGSGTYTKPPGAKWIRVVAVGGGGGGGSGSLQASGAAGTGGSGGGGAVNVAAQFDAASIGATVTVTIGAGGTAGTAVTTSAGPGVAGSIGNDSSFGTFVAYAGGGGAGGVSGAVRSGGSGAGTAGDGLSGTNAALNGGLPNTTTGPGSGGGGAGVSGTNVAGQPAENGGGSGGGGPNGAAGHNGGTSLASGGGGASGGGINTTTTDFAGGTGGGSGTYVVLGGGGGTAGTTAGGNGGAGANGNYSGSGGGGGGGSALSSAAGGTGGAGGTYGAGGGGGGAGRLLAGVGSSGAGGAGGAGLVIVTTFF